MLLGSASPISAADKPVSPPKDSHPLAELPELPTRVLVDHDGRGLKATDRQGARFTSASAVVKLVTSAAGQEVRVSCPTGPLARVVLRWETTFPVTPSFSAMRGNAAMAICNGVFSSRNAILPWYFAAHQDASGRTFMAGVKTQPAALCFWTVDAAGVSLWLDFRNGGGPSLPGDREIAAATIVSLWRRRRGIAPGGAHAFLPRDVSVAPARGRADLRQQQLVLCLWPQF